MKPLFVSVKVWGPEAGWPSVLSVGLWNLGPPVRSLIGHFARKLFPTRGIPHTLDINDSVNYLLTKISKNIEFVKYTFIIRKSQEEIEYSNNNFFRDAQLSLCGEQ